MIILSIHSQLVPIITKKLSRLGFFALFVFFSVGLLPVSADINNSQSGEIISTPAKIVNQSSFVTIFGILFLDINGNGAQDENEELLENLTLVFTDSNGVSYSTQTNNEGEWRIDLSEGNYDVDIDSERFNVNNSVITVVPDSNRIDFQIVENETDLESKPTTTQSESKVIATLSESNDAMTNDTNTSENKVDEENFPSWIWLILVIMSILIILFSLLAFFGRRSKNTTKEVITEK